MTDDVDFVCSACGARLGSQSDNGGASGSWVCSECDAQAGVWIDGGVLDLECIQPSAEIEGFQVWAEPPPGEDR